MQVLLCRRFGCEWIAVDYQAIVGAVAAEQRSGKVGDAGGIAPPNVSQHQPHQTPLDSYIPCISD